MLNVREEQKKAKAHKAKGRRGGSRATAPADGEGGRAHLEEFGRRGGVKHRRRPDYAAKERKGARGTDYGAPEIPKRAQKTHEGILCNID